MDVLPLLTISCCSFCKSDLQRGRYNSENEVSLGINSIDEGHGIVSFSSNEMFLLSPTFLDFTLNMGGPIQIDIIGGIDTSFFSSPLLTD